MDTVRDVEDALRRRYWLKENFEWFMAEVTFHKEMSKYMSDRRVVIWHFDSKEGKAVIDEAAFRSE